MKILIIRTHPTEININTYNVQELGLAKALVGLGHQCDIILYTERESRIERIPLRNGEIKINWMHGRNFLWQGIYDWREMCQLASDYDYIQVNEYNQLASYYMMQKYPEKCYIYHGPYYNPDDKKYNVLNWAFDILFHKKIVKNNPLIFAKSKLAEKSLNNKGFANVVTVGVGLDTERFSECADANVHKKEDNYYHLLYIGEISERRNTLFLIDVFYSVNCELDGKARLHIIGKGNGDYTNEVKKHVKKLQLDKYVEFIDRKEQNELPAVYRKADIFVFPTKYDIFGMVLLESLYFGVPVVSSKNGGSETLLANGECGCIIDTFEIGKWSSAIVDILRDKSRRKYMSNHGIQQILDFYTWDAIAKKMLERISS